MERFSHRESVLLGYSPQRSHPNDPVSSPKSLCKDSDIDFNDVFGGPPRRAPVQETRCSFGESAETHWLRRASNEETSSYRLRLSGPGEKPVFGEEGVHRRRYPNEDFFGDIFRGNESLSSSPRKNNRDPFSSSPSSRVLSPVRPLQPRVEPFASSSPPTQFSLPGKLIKGTDLPMIRSSARNHLKNKDGTSNGLSFYLSSPLFRFSSPANQVQEESGNDVYFQSSLTEDLSNSCEDSSSLVKPDKGSNLKKGSNGSEVPNISNQFHFSIYKWASKGIPLALPLRGGNSSKSKEKIKFDRSSSASGQIACEGMEKELPAVTPQDIEIELDKKENGFLLSSSNHGRVGQIIKEAALLKSEADGPNVIHFQNTKEKTKPHSVLDTGLFDKTEEQIFSTATQEAPKSKLKKLCSLLLGSDEIAITNEIKESKGKSITKSPAVFDDGGKFKKQDGKAAPLNNEEMDKANFKGSPIKPRDILAKHQGRGKVKEFVKIFNQEASNKPKFSGNSQIQSSGWKEGGKSRTQEDVSVTTARKENEKVLFPDANKNNTPHASVVVEGFLKQSEKQLSETRTYNNKSTVISSGLMDTPASIAGLSEIIFGQMNDAMCDASIPEDSEVIVRDLDDSFGGNILIKELPQHEDELPEAGDRQDKIQVIDAKIRKWSNEKEGNIRSLLSTLQYVLWPESGWKPVPLVDIIEGNAVKRSYQKALLSLHPDKLQQEGAPSNQKYIAEKVFDILQEAWTHFNSLGSV